MVIELIYFVILLACVVFLARRSAISTQKSDNDVYDVRYLVKSILMSILAFAILFGITLWGLQLFLILTKGVISFIAICALFVSLFVVLNVMLRD